MNLNSSRDKSMSAFIMLSSTVRFSCNSAATHVPLPFPVLSGDCPPTQQHSHLPHNLSQKAQKWVLSLNVCRQSTCYFFLPLAEVLVWIWRCVIVSQLSTCTSCVCSGSSILVWTLYMGAGVPVSSVCVWVSSSLPFNCLRGFIWWLHVELRLQKQTHT